MALCNLVELICEIIINYIYENWKCFDVWYMRTLYAYCFDRVYINTISYSCKDWYLCYSGQGRDSA